MSNQLDNRGTGDALYNYAHYNEEILGNESWIMTYISGNHDSKAKQRFLGRFSNRVVYMPQELGGLDAIYHIKSGAIDGFDPQGKKYLVHAVFDNQPHGDAYATISPWMSERFNIPYVPHIVQVADTDENFRKSLDIPEEAVVFARYGGQDTFDINWVWGAIISFIMEHPDAYFIFMNTDHPDFYHKQLKFLPGTVDPIQKRRFINTSDAMIHARARGETFGLSVGEFAICGKPVITYSESHERAHLQELGQFALTYKDERSLKTRLNQVMAGPMVSWGYGQYTPENVMKKFDEVFLSCVK